MSSLLGALRWALLATVIATVLTASLLILAGAAEQARAVVIGAGMVAAFFLVGALTTAAVIAYAPRLSLLVAVLTYALQVLALAIIGAAMVRTGGLQQAVDLRWLGVTVIIAALLWSASIVWQAGRMPPLQPVAGNSPGGDPGRAIREQGEPADG